MSRASSPRITDSYFEYKADFHAPMFDAWGVPNLLASSLFPQLRRWGITLADITWSKEPRNYKEIQLTITVLRMNASVHLGVDSATFTALDPDWSRASALVELFETAMASVRNVTGAQIASQEAALTFHVVPGQENLSVLTARLVNVDVLGTARMYGIALYREDSSLVMDKSLRYDGAVFIRLNRAFSGSASFSEIAAVLYKDEVKALEFFGLQSLISGEE